MPLEIIFTVGWAAPSFRVLRGLQCGSLALIAAVLTILILVVYLYPGNFWWRRLKHVGVTPLVLMIGSLFARKLVMWPYSNCVVCRHVWRRKPTVDDDNRVVDTSCINLARLMMLRCLRPTPPYFVSRNTSARLIFDDTFSLPNNAHRVELCIKSICFCVSVVTNYYYLEANTSCIGLVVTPNAAFRWDPGSNPGRWAVTISPGFDSRQMSGISPPGG